VFAFSYWIFVSYCDKLMRIFACRVVVTAQAMEPEANLVEKYFGVKYGYEKLSKEQLNVCIGHFHSVPF
jgi:uncharacterized protein (DUF1015 family)